MNWKTLARLGLIAVMALLVSSAYAQTFSVIHTFTGSGGDGAIPYAGVTLHAGRLFGTTQDGGLGNGSGSGTVYEMTHVGFSWAYSPIFLFPTDMSGGAGPVARVVLGPEGHLYGTTNYGGAYQGAGVVFNLTPPISICKTVYCSWKENVLWNFGNGTDGANPGYGDLIWDDSGTIYGTTVNGGGYNSGTVYQLTNTQNQWSERLTVAFNNQNYEYCPAGSPWGGVLSLNGSLFGTGAYGPFGGNVWQLSGYNLSCIAGFAEQGTHGADPYAGVIADSSGNLYGTASDAGANGAGTVFELPPPYGQQLNVLYSFSGTPGQDCGPWGRLTMDAAGNLYGTTRCTGAYQQGTVFKLTNTAEGWVYSLLYDFTGGDDGARPVSSVTVDSDGTLYGTASRGGANNLGVVWMIKP
jgi:uncharacterized repeat protein (TIGR03803 family)